MDFATKATGRMNDSSGISNAHLTVHSVFVPTEFLKKGVNWIEARYLVLNHDNADRRQSAV